ncbi:hypothetical protein LJR230_002364 [Trinickia sp. LjRoot230]|uniref:hypothetical protein n=1 Tax=Trinickia sp. LjRoot230 TaxID=3342288 RepID=UPI003ECC923E
MSNWELSFYQGGALRAASGAKHGMCGRKSGPAVRDDLTSRGVCGGARKHASTLATLIHALCASIDIAHSGAATSLGVC